MDEFAINDYIMYRDLSVVLKITEIRDDGNFVASYVCEGDGSYKFESRGEYIAPPTAIIKITEDSLKIYMDELIKDVHRVIAILSHRLFPQNSKDVTKDFI